MLEDAIISIRSANEAAVRRDNALFSRRRPVQLLDKWLSQVEFLIEHDERVVPEPLTAEIAGFLATLDTGLHRRLRRKGRLEAGQVLDVLFEAEELFLPRVSDSTDDRDVRMAVAGHRL
jgi:hypothetical protein